MQDFSGPALLGRLLRKSGSLSPTRLSRSMGHLSRMIRLTTTLVTPGDRCNDLIAVPTTPIWQRLQAYTHIGLGSSAFARRYSRNRGYFLFLQVLRCFNSLGSPPRTYEFSPRILHYEAQWVAPFGNPRIIGCLHLPEAYRSLPRPSSPV